MNEPSNHGRGFPMRFNLHGEALAIRVLSPKCRDAIGRFACALPEEDLLFLERDITQPQVVDRWIEDVAAGKLMTIVAWRGAEVVGYATFDRGTARWTRHVAELRVVVAESMRKRGLGRLLLELVFEMALDEGVRKVIARMPPTQTRAQDLFQRLGFEQEAVLRDNAMDANGLTHDLLVLSFHDRHRDDNRCGSCGVPVLTALSLDGMRLCSHCYETRYEELGGGG